MGQILYLGIDQSYTSTGIVLLDCAGEMIVGGHLLIRSDPQQDIFKRAWYVTEHITKIVQQHQPKVIAIEGLAFSKFGNASRDLAGLQFVIVTMLKFVLNQQVEIVSPNLLKKFATTKGNAKKDEMYAALPERIRQGFSLCYKKTKGLFDVTDAFWLAKYAYELDQKKQKNKTK